jgi:hypothetical protein
MKRFIVFFVLLICLGCRKDDCYDCTQSVKIYTNKIIKDYPKNYKSKFVSCGENIYLVDKELPIVENDTIGDTIFTYWRDTECIVR